MIKVIPDLEATGFEALTGIEDANDPRVVHVTEPISVGALRGGMQSGGASVAFCFELPDGRVALAETSLALFSAAARALAARYGE